MQYVALLRGINVGGHRVKMDRLRALFEELGLQDVSTFIASGNVIFSTDSADTDSLTERIERHLAQELGYEVPTFLRLPGELAEIAAFEPPAAERGAHPEPSLYVDFLSAPPSKQLRDTLTSLCSETDNFFFSKREVYWLIQGKLSESPLFAKEFEKATRGVPATMRNVTTLRRLVAKLAP